MDELTQRAAAVERNIQGQYDNIRAQLGPLSAILAGAAGDVAGPHQEAQLQFGAGPAGRPAPTQLPPGNPPPAIPGIRIVFVRRERLG